MRLPTSFGRKANWLRTIFAILTGVMLIALVGGRCPEASSGMQTIELPAWYKGAAVSAYIIRTNSLSPGDIIRVQVDGVVMNPGWIELPNGSTVLEAVKQAGGFDQWADYREIYVKQDGQEYFLRLHHERLWRRGCGRVWYGPGHSDFVLASDAKVFVTQSGLFR